MAALADDDICPIVAQAIAGYDPDEVTSQDRPVGQYLAAMRKGRGRLRIGVPREFFYANLHPEIQAAIDQALAVLVTLGGETRDMPLELEQLTILQQQVG